MVNHPNRSARNSEKYYSKLPRQSLADAVLRCKRSGFSRSLEAATKLIEEDYAPGCTREPFIQLIRENEHGAEVISEWETSTGKWLSVLVAAGLVSRSIS